MALRLCSGCSRHVRAADAACPFCGDAGRGAVPSPVSRATRAAMVFGGAAMVTTAVACSSATPLYGAPAPDASADTGADASPAPLYGAVPPPDASPDASPAPLYGAVPPPDAGDDAAPDASDASPAPLYGLPPP
ncbi:MAG TPA: hypothetical protein PLR99_29085 [Polyangiaceae bacterium]|nr:hypothetical protein [Polyangiaceae bacterium]